MMRPQAHPHCPLTLMRMIMACHLMQINTCLVISIVLQIEDVLYAFQLMFLAYVMHVLCMEHSPSCLMTMSIVLVGWLVICSEVTVHVLSDPMKTQPVRRLHWTWKLHQWSHLTFSIVCYQSWHSIQQIHCMKSRTLLHCNHLREVRIRGPLWHSCIPFIVARAFWSCRWSHVAVFVNRASH